MEIAWYFLQKSQTVLKKVLVRVNSCPGILKDIKDVVWGDPGIL